MCLSYLNICYRVHRLCKDNNCRFICDAFGFWIQDKIMGSVLLKELYRAGLYHISLSILSILQPHLQHASSFHNNQLYYLGQQIKTSLWHKCFDHPSNKITSALLNQSQIPFTSNTFKLVCTTCLEAKLAKLFFSYLAVKSVKPLEVIHSDV